jgi:hypothetical protein
VAWGTGFANSRKRHENKTLSAEGKTPQYAFSHKRNTENLSH